MDTYFEIYGYKSSKSENMSCYIYSDLAYEVFSRKPGWREIFRQIDRVHSNIQSQEDQEGDLLNLLVLKNDKSNKGTIASVGVYDEVDIGFSH